VGFGSHKISPGLQFLNVLVNVTRERPQARPNAAISQFHGFAGGYQAAGALVQMRPHASKVTGRFGHRYPYPT
jgi:hypothetical protein